LTVIADKKLKFYLDTTIPNYVFTVELPEKMKLTKILFEKITQGEYEAYISDVVIAELKQAKEPKRSKLLSLVKDIIRLPFTPESRDLAEEYIKNKIISKNYLADARHIAIATVYNIDAVVSWNYEHLVNINKIRMINIVNEIRGYKHIEIISPEGI